MMRQRRQLLRARQVCFMMAVAVVVFCTFRIGTMPAWHDGALDIPAPALTTTTDDGDDDDVGDGGGLRDGGIAVRDKGAPPVPCVTDEGKKTKKEGEVKEMEKEGQVPVKVVEEQQEEEEEEKKKKETEDEDRVVGEEEEEAIGDKSKVATTLSPTPTPTAPVVMMVAGGPHEEEEEKEDDGARHLEPPAFQPLHRTKKDGEPCFDPRRDYRVWPVRIEGWWDGEQRCDVPCHGGRGGPIGVTDAERVRQEGEYWHDDYYVDATKDYAPSDACQAQYSFTMENVAWNYEHDHTKRFANVHSPYQLYGSVYSDSDVMMQYFSWTDYQIMNPVAPKTADAQVVAFISNCAPQKRLQWLREIQKHGVKVHSYGPCENNRPPLPRVPMWLGQKNNVTAQYKFTWAFENAETPDYVTEKLFGPFTVGSVPIYNGAPNVMDFLPSEKSAIIAHNFSSPAELAKYILYLDQNDTAYREYLKWKEDGPSSRFMAHADISRAHSSCRFCIKVADVQRMHVGQQFAGNPWEEENRLAAAKAKADRKPYMLRVRERGKFWLREIYIAKATYKALMAAINERYKDQPEKFPIYGIYDLWDSKRTPITTDKQVEEIITSDAYPEVEIIFLEPGAPDRESYTEWYYKKIGKPVPPRP